MQNTEKRQLHLVRQPLKVSDLQNMQLCLPGNANTPNNQSHHPRPELYHASTVCLEKSPRLSQRLNGLNYPTYCCPVLTCSYNVLKLL